ncbi:hypothetical protein RAMDARK_0015 [Rickettsia amblyommatis str. Darkwater]|nr:hypothetical protein RAMDARK_0015 [Rickettsia amblyommatis str. Darkwater]
MCALVLPTWILRRHELSDYKILLHDSAFSSLREELRSN